MKKYQKEMECFIENKGIISKSNPNYYYLLKTYLNTVRRGEEIYSILSHYSSLNAKIAVDIGCGAGGTTVALNKHGLCQVVGVDISSKTMLLAKKTKAILKADTEFIVADGRCLPIKNGCADFVICSDMMHYLKNPTLLSLEIKRIIHKGGIIYLTTRNRLALTFGSWYRGLYPILCLLPKSLSDFIVRCLGVGEKFGVEHPFFFIEIKRMFEHLGLELEDIDFTLRWPVVARHREKGHLSFVAEIFNRLPKESRLYKILKNVVLWLKPSWTFIARN